MITVLVIQWHEDADDKAIKWKMEEWLEVVTANGMKYGVEKVVSMRTDD